MADCRIPPGKICKTRGGSRKLRLSRADVLVVANICGIDEYHVKGGRRKKKTMDDLCEEIRRGSAGVPRVTPKPTKAKRPKPTKAKRPRRAQRVKEEEKLPPVSAAKKRTVQLSYDETWKLLTATYNTNVLDDLTPTMRKRFYDYAQDNEKFTYDPEAKVPEDVNPVLVQLIMNHKDNYKPVVRTISGPHSLSQHYSPETHKTIYVFGEYHHKDSECREMRGDMRAIDYLEALFHTTDVFIDFFLEISNSTLQTAHDKRRALSPGEYLDPASMNELKGLLEVFSPCIPKFAKKIELLCDLARVHYADVRDIGGRRILDEFVVKWWRVRKRRPWKSGADFPPVVKEVLRHLDGMSRTDFESFVVDNFLGNSVVMKEIQRSLCPDLIMEYFTDLAKKLARKNYRETADCVHSLSRVLSGKTSPPVKRITRFLNNLTNILIDVDTVTMDAYVMSRVFKRFRVSKKKPQPKVPHNIIIYAGDFHSRVYRDFLKFIGFQLVAQTTPVRSMFKKDGETVSRCVRMGNFPQPFFSSF